MKSLILALVLIIGTAFTSMAHEPDYKHLKGNTYGIMETSSCYLGTLWGLDTDDDYILDRCIAVVVSHGRGHYVPVQVMLKDGEMSCSCEPTPSS